MAAVNNGTDPSNHVKIFPYSVFYVFYEQGYIFYILTPRNMVSYEMLRLIGKVVEMWGKKLFIPLIYTTFYKQYIEKKCVENE